jgi:hypothetical protein
MQWRRHSDILSSVYIHNLRTNSVVRRLKAAIQNDWCASVGAENAHVPFDIQQFYKTNQNHVNAHITMINPMAWLAMHCQPTEENRKI